MTLEIKNLRKTIFEVYQFPVKMIPVGLSETNRMENYVCFQEVGLKFLRKSAKIKKCSEMTTRKSIKMKMCLKMRLLAKIVPKIWCCPGGFLPVLHTFSDTNTAGDL